MQYWTTNVFERPEAIDDEETKPFRIEATRDCNEGHLEHPRIEIFLRQSRVTMMRMESNLDANGD